MSEILCVGDDKFESKVGMGSQPTKAAQEIEGEGSRRFENLSVLGGSIHALGPGTPHECARLSACHGALDELAVVWTRRCDQCRAEILD